MGICGGFTLSVFKNARYCGTAGSIIAEWNACETGICTAWMPISVNMAIASSTEWLSPAITVCVGQFLLATATYPCTRASSGSTRSTDAATEAILPLSATRISLITLPRVQTALRPFSKSNIPAAIAAAYSPKLCPMTTSGLMPKEESRRIMATSAVSTAGWVISVRLMAASRSAMCSLVSPGLLHSVSVSVWPIMSISRRSASSKVSCTTLYLAAKSFIMSTYCEPWPGNIKQTLGLISQGVNG